MYKSNCYNYDWFVMWLERSLVSNSNQQNLLSAKNISDNFSRLYFEVSIEDVTHAMKQIGYSCVIKQGEEYYCVSYTDEVSKKLWKTWE